MNQLANIATLINPIGDVGESGDLERVRRLAARDGMDAAGIALLSTWLRRYGADWRCPEHSGADCPVCGGSGVVMLREPQAVALRELADMRGLFAPMRVGSGKTLVTLLAATVLDARRPVLMVPASCVDKTRDEFVTYFKAWRVRMPYVLSYEMLSHPDHERDLLDLAPDLLMLDEAHKARNRDAAVSRRIRRCIEQVNPIVVALSGTLITDRLMDYQHHAVWSLRGNAPVPAIEAEAERWAAAVDKDVPLLHRAGPGALVSLPGGFHEHLRSRRGVVPTPGSDCAASIEISRWRPTLPVALRQAIDATAASGLRPDGELLDPLRVPDCLCELAMGFFNVWDPMPPAWWLGPRRSYFGYERAILDEHLDGFDSPEHVRRGLDRAVARREGPHPPAWQEGAELLAEWRAVKDRFVPNSVPVWIDDAPVQQCADTVERGMIVWTKRRAVGERLANVYGLPYYGAGSSPQAHRGAGAIVCSIAAHGTGKNLQRWHTSRVLHPPAKADAWEQLIGRTHRAGQRADVVRVQAIDVIDYHAEVLERVRRQAHEIQRASGFEQKLVAATWV